MLIFVYGIGSWIHTNDLFDQESFLTTSTKTRASIEH